MTWIYTHKMIAIIAMGALLFVAPLAFAQGGPGPQMQNEGMQPADICADVDAFVDGVEERLQQARNDFSAHYNDRVAEMESRRLDAEATQAERRAEHDERMENRLAELAELAETEQEIAAVEEFASMVRGLVSEYRVDADMANESFRDAMDALMGSQVGATSSVSTERAEAVAEILDDISQMCENGAGSNEVLQTFRTRMQSLRSSTSGSRIDTEALRAEVEALRNERKQAVETARAELQEGIRLARNELFEVLNLDNN